MVPGTSHHLILELENNLVVVRGGISSFNQLLESCASCLNSIIDLINNDSPEILSKINTLNALNRLHELEDSVSRNSSSLSRSHYSSEAIKMELDLPQSERKILLSANDSRHSDQDLISKASVTLLAVAHSSILSPGPPSPPAAPSQSALTCRTSKSIRPSTASIPLPIQTDPLFDRPKLSKDDLSAPASPLYLRIPHSKHKNEIYSVKPLKPQGKPRNAELLKVNSHSGVALTDVTTASKSISPRASMKDTKRTKDSKSSTAAKSFRFQSSPKPEKANAIVSRPSLEHANRIGSNCAPSSAQKKKEDDSSEAGLSPVQLLPAAQNTSPNVDLSFIPIAKTINPKKFGGPNSHPSSDKRESDDGTDNSFQAISTAIRKSFAGNASIAHNTLAAIVYKAERDATASRTFTETNPVKRETTFTLKPVYNNFRPTLEPSKRASIFVSLPNREPISLRNSTRQSIQVKRETAEDILAKHSSPREKPSASSPDSLQNPVLQAKEEKVSMIKPKSLTKTPKSSAEISPKLGFALRPNLSSRAQSPMKVGLVSSAKTKNRTAANGSPRRVEVPMLRDTIQATASSCSKRASPDRFNSPLKRPARSPLAPDSRQSLRSNATSSPRTARPAEVSKDANVRKKSSIIKNRFLVTKLNPKNPPTFVPTKVVAQRLSPKFSCRSTLSNVPDLQWSPVDKDTSVLSRKSGIVSSLGNRHEVNSDQINHYRTNSPKREMPVKSKIPSAHSNLLKVVPRRRPAGNAIPLPEAARGLFVRARLKDKNASHEQKTPQRWLKAKPEVESSLRANSSPLLTNEGLPDIPSDDEELRNKKYLKSWAETPEIIRVLNEQPAQDPRVIFGEFPVLKMNEVFGSVSPGIDSR